MLLQTSLTNLHALLCSAEFESRFQFDDNLPDPDPWRPGPKTYPSQNVKAKQSECMPLWMRPMSFVY